MINLWQGLLKVRLRREGDKIMFRLYIPTDEIEASCILGLNNLKKNDLYGVDGFFNKSCVYNIKGNRKKIIIREIDPKYGADLQSRFKFNFNPMSVLEVPNRRVLDGVARKLLPEFGWVGVVDEKERVENRLSKLNLEELR